MDKIGKDRLDYMLEVGDSKGNFPPTPHRNDDEDDAVD